MGAKRRISWILGAAAVVALGAGLFGLPRELAILWGLAEQPALRASVERVLYFGLALTSASVALLVLGAVRRRERLEQLRAAARRMAGDDTTTSVVVSPAKESAGLATAMEELRLRMRSTSAALREREAEARSLLEGVDEGVFAVDGERRIQYLNPRAARLLGLEPAAAIGRFCGDVLRPASVEGPRPCEDNCPIVHARSRGSSRAVEHLELPAGRRTAVVTSAPPQGSRQVQLLRDETELETARRQRDAVLANVSHELKTPLSAQLASIELLQEALERADGTAAKELLAALERSALRLTRLIDNLLESVRIETGHAPVRRAEVDLATCVDDARALVEPLLVQRGQSLVVELPALAAKVVGDRVQLAQVLVNLLANAHKHAPDGSKIAVGGRAQSGDVSLWVDDEGPGVAATESASIFDRAWRAPGGAADGMGLGLWIVKAIVERHGGSVGVGAAPGGGARFLVTLPAGEQRA